MELAYPVVREVFEPFNGGNVAETALDRLLRQVGGCCSLAPTVNEVRRVHRLFGLAGAEGSDILFAVCQRAPDLSLELSQDTEQLVSTHGEGVDGFVWYPVHFPAGPPPSET